METSWRTLSKNYNRYIQRFRRQFPLSDIQYIRAIEAHKDGYPHIHEILQFKNSLNVKDARYFDPELFRRFKGLWSHGLSDYQPPRGDKQPILYLIKYISKSSNSHRTIWKKMLKNIQLPKSQDARNQNTTTQCQDILSANAVKFALTDLNCKKYKLRQLSWSRKFTFPVLAPAAIPKSLLQMQIK